MAHYMDMPRLMSTRPLDWWCNHVVGGGLQIHFILIEHYHLATNAAHKHGPTVVVYLPFVCKCGGLAAHQTYVCD